jgi:hypothetical protein
VPGPGQYNIPSVFQFGPAYTMAKRTPRKDVKEDVPGVGTYDCVSANQGTGPAFTVATRPPAFSRTDDVPGPGAYYAPERDRYATTILIHSFTTAQVFRRLSSYVTAEAVCIDTLLMWRKVTSIDMFAV